MDQDELEDQMLLTLLREHLMSVKESLGDLAQALNIPLDLLDGKSEAIVVFSILICVLCWLVKSQSFSKIHKYLLLNADGSLLMDSTVWEHQERNVVVCSVQGRRPTMEDRFILCSIPVVDGKSVKIASVLDGHGGQFAVDYVKKHFLANLTQKIKLLKALASQSLSNKEKLACLEKSRGDKIVTKPLLKFLKLSEADFKELCPKGKVQLEEMAKPKLSASAKKEPASNVSSGPIMSSRVKALEEVPTLKNHPIESVLTLNTSSPGLSKKKTSSSSACNSNAIIPKPKSNSKSNSRKPPMRRDLSELLLPEGQIAYDLLLKEEIAHVDIQLMQEGRKRFQIGGTTLLFSIMDQDQLWVANVGDSRGILVNTKGEVTPLSYDHKPCQEKEKKRIEENGGYVEMNGVWRVQGILATSRALGDFPLKDKNLITCEPDVMKFKLRGSNPSFAVLASDGLWDTHTNEGVAHYVRKRLKKGRSPKDVARSLVEDAMDKDSLDNITVLLMDLKKYV
ncbi:protein phosphatase 1L-like [Tigriopus californicus]|uniref:protein phosphatase 1L-like n=1 Tax=Tigriopus californicus TaxID=6832 RepID=UPI0027DA06A8|nr:protein phosphatase 1L-like [Tigriopus californicus]